MLTVSCVVIYCRTRNSNSHVSIGLKMIAKFQLHLLFICTDYLWIFNQHISFEVFYRRYTFNRIWDLIPKLTGVDLKGIKAVFGGCNFREV